MGREITWTQDKKMLKDEKTQKKKKKMAHNGYLWVF
jgi:hypothetical protein